MERGHWMVRCCRYCPEVAARIWLCDHEPGIPDNKLDQPFVQGQIGLDLVGPERVWEMVWFAEASPEERAALINPALSARSPRNGRQHALVTAPLAKWKQERARRISAAEFDQQVDWLKWAARRAPTHPDYTYRKPVDPAAAATPRFGASP